MAVDVQDRVTLNGAQRAAGVELEVARSGVGDAVACPDHEQSVAFYGHVGFEARDLQGALADV